MHKASASPYARAAPLAALLLAFFSGTAAFAQPREARAQAPLPTVVVFPLQGTQPLAEDLTAALTARLGSTTCGLKALPFDVNSPTVQRALREHEFLRAAMNPIASPVVADVLGDAVGADLTLMATAETQGGQAKLSARLAATKSRVSRDYQASAQLPQGWPDNLLPTAARALVDGLLDPVIGQMCADAKSLLQQVLADAPEHYRRGQELMTQGKAAEASLEFNVATALEPGNAGYHVAAGEAYAALGDTQGAVVEYKRALQITPDMPMARLRLAQLNLQTGKPQEAARVAESLVEADPSNVEARLVLARALAASGDQAKALDQYERLLAYQANNEEALRAAAAAYDDRQAWDKAIPLYSRLVDVAPGDDHVRERLIQLLVKVGNLPQAVAELRRAFDLLGEPVRYQLPQFVAVVRVMDRECLAVIREAASDYDAYQSGRITRARLAEDFKSLHQRSDNLYHAADRLSAPELLARAHRFRVLACAVLNESDFELVRFAGTEEKWRYDRAKMLRDSAQNALSKAQSLEAEAGWPTITEAER
jgi:tetratricopeptide (TPR) repeat protein